MSLTTLRAKSGKASEKAARLVRKARKSASECVLVVYEQQGASIYYEGPADADKAGRGPR